LSGVEQPTHHTKGSPKETGKTRDSGVKHLTPEQQEELDLAYWANMDFKKYKSMAEVPKDIRNNLKGEIKKLADQFNEPQFSPSMWLANQDKNFPGKTGAN
jgi:hypothetical protein